MDNEMGNEEDGFGNWWVLEQERVEFGEGEVKENEKVIEVQREREKLSKVNLLEIVLKFLSYLIGFN